MFLWFKLVLFAVWTEIPAIMTSFTLKIGLCLLFPLKASVPLHIRSSPVNVRVKVRDSNRFRVCFKVRVNSKKLVSFIKRSCRSVTQHHLRVLLKRLNCSENANWVSISHHQNPDPSDIREIVGWSKFQPQQNVTFWLCAGLFNKIWRTLRAAVFAWKGQEYSTQILSICFLAKMKALLGYRVAWQCLRWTSSPSFFSWSEWRMSLPRTFQLLVILSDVWGNFTEPMLFAFSNSFTLLFQAIWLVR